MDYLSLKKIKQVVNEISRSRKIGEPSGIFDRSISIDGQARLISPVVLLAKQIKEYCPDIVSKKKVINIVIAGADFMECTGNGTAYNLLNTVLGSDSEWKIRLVGKEAVSNPIRSMIKVNKNKSDDRIEVSMHHETLQHHIKEHGVPDILCLNHPGFESFHESWLENDNGILNCINSNIMIFGSSYSTDEYAIDRIYLEAYGFRLVEHHFNGLANQLRVSHGDIAGMPSTVQKSINNGLSDWGGTYWKLIAGDLKKSEEKQEFIKDYSEVTSSVAYYLHQSGIIENLFDASVNYLFIWNGNKCVRIYGQYALNLSDFCIYDYSTGELMTSDVEVEDFDISSINDKSIINTTLFMTTIYQNYIKGNTVDDESDASPTLGDLASVIGEMSKDDISSILSIFGIDDADIDASYNHIQSMVAPKVKKQLNDGDKKIINLINEKDFDALSSLEHKELVHFKDELGRNLAAISAILDSVELYKIAKSVGVNLCEIDNDGYSLLDTAVEYGSINVAKFAIESGDVGELIDRQGAAGFTPCHHCFTRNRPEMLDMLIENGANIDIKSNVGFTVRWMMSRYS